MSRTHDKVQVVCPNCERMYYVSPHEAHICPNCGHISDLDEQEEEE